MYDSSQVRGRLLSIVRGRSVCRAGCADTSRSVVLDSLAMRIAIQLAMTTTPQMLVYVRLMWSEAE